MSNGEGYTDKTADAAIARVSKWETRNKWSDSLMMDKKHKKKQGLTEDPAAAISDIQADPEK